MPSALHAKGCGLKRYESTDRTWDNVCVKVIDREARKKVLLDVLVTGRGKVCLDVLTEYPDGYGWVEVKRNTQQRPVGDDQLR